jgi:hypothetical protein
VLEFQSLNGAIAKSFNQIVNSTTADRNNDPRWETEKR